MGYKIGGMQKRKRTRKKDKEEGQKEETAYRKIE